MGRSEMLRWLVRGVCLLAAVATLLPASDALGLTFVVPSLSPFVAAAALAATRTFQVSMALGLAVALAALARPRFFCRWMCPTGLCADGASRLGYRLGLLRQGLPVLGPWIAVVTLAGACLGYPLLLWLDPLAMFCGLFSVFGPRWEAAVGWSAAGVPAVLLLSFLMPGAWCRRLCPLGGMQDLLASVAGLARRATAGDHPDSRGERRETGSVRLNRSRCRLGRRVVLGSIAGIAWAMATRRARADAAGPLRPPGARAEADFTGLCVRCGNCVRACPAAILSPDPGRHGVAGFLAPLLRFESEYCLETCVRCTAVCPSGALERLTQETKIRGRIGLPQVDMNVCLLGDDRECSACRSRCPYEAITYVFSEVEYTLTPRIDPEKCPGCGACEVACPTRPVKAIVVQRRAVPGRAD